MRITEATLPAREPAAVEGFYRDVLGLRVDRDAGGVRVRVGASLLAFVSEPYRGAQHIAFTIPTGSFAGARLWLSGRTALLSQDGSVEFEGPPSWDSRSLYFDGPDEQVLELIERRRLPGGADQEAGPGLLQNISEVGLAVPDVSAAVQRLTAAGATPFGGEPAADFAAVGDDDGLLILSAIGRPWRPTGRVALPSPATITVHDAAPVALTALQRIVARSG